MATISRTPDRQREALRRAALSTDQGPTAQEQSSAFPRGLFHDRFLDPQDPTNVTFPFLRRMRRDHIVAMGLHFIAMPIVKAPWYYQCDEARVAAFADAVLRPIYGRLVLCFLRMLWAGYSPGSKNFEAVTAPTWTYLPSVTEDSALVWNQPTIDAIVFKPVTPVRPENAKPRWDNNGNFAGINYDKSYGGVGYFTIAGQRRQDIDLVHAFWAAHDVDSEDGSAYGFSRIAHCAPIFHMYRYIWTLLGRAFENNADPGPVVRYPSTGENTTDSQGNALKPVDQALLIGRRRRSGSTVALPSDQYVDFQDKPTGKYLWEIEYPKNDTNFQEIQQFLGFLESAKLRAIWLQEQGLIAEAGGSSNRNVASEFGSQRDESQAVLMAQIDGMIDEMFMKPIIAMNFPLFAGKLEKKTFGFGQNDEDVVRQVIQLIGQAQSENALATLGVNIQKLMEARGFPMYSLSDQKSLRDKAAAAAEAAPPPAVTPTQGRRALVTQTGFDRETDKPIMQYVQLGGEIHLADDDDFVASLPRNDVFSDKQVIAATRHLRSQSVSFLSWAYSDFARYLGKQKTLDLDELARSIAAEHFSVAGEHLDDQMIAVRVVDRLISGWRPKVEKIAGYSDQARSAIARVYDRTTGLHLERLSAKKRLSSRDKAASLWIDARATALMNDVLGATRSQLAESLANAVSEGTKPAQLAAAVREALDGVAAARASTIALAEASSAYNYATVQAGLAASVAKAQVQPAGMIVDVADALAQDRLSSDFCVRLLPGAHADLEVRYEQLDGLSARYDNDTHTVLFSPDLGEDDQRAYMIALADRFLEPQLRTGDVEVP